MTRNATLGALVFTLLLVTTGLSGAVGASETVQSGPAEASAAPLARGTTATQSQTANESATISFGDQSSNGSAVTVESANLSAGGYVVVFAQNGTALGNTSYLEPGTHENLTVSLGTPIGRSQVLIAAPHLDTDGDRTFDFNATQAQAAGAQNATDRPYLQPNGLPVNAVGFVTVGNASRQGTATE
ncbi:DUF7282 domain-containing protein [Halorussus caseinilyticus]|uniref:DUF7282 domain-containing protein n=1 Tax=Halorussus caseinilyticus TaxID=3034025 RepID=A0ABD5WEY5_9EURY|nr:hypothetical protein [Halorussus sp. DT72]